MWLIMCRKYNGDPVYISSVPEQQDGISVFVKVLQIKKPEQHLAVGISGDISPTFAVRFKICTGYYAKLLLMYCANWDFFRAARLRCIIPLLVSLSIIDSAFLYSSKAESLESLWRTLFTAVLYADLCERFRRFCFLLKIIRFFVDL